MDVDKVGKEDLEREMNGWLLRVNFISSGSYENWKNKVMSLSKMWKNAAELLGDKKIEKSFELPVL